MASGGAFSYPISQPYGPSQYASEPPLGPYAHYHQGVDYAAPAGTPVYAPQGGTVVSNTLGETGYGPNLVLIKMANGLIQLFGHMATSTVSPGQAIAAGQQIGTVGSLGNSTGPHLHYGVLTQNGIPLNPYPYASGQTTGVSASQAQSIPIVTGVQNAVSAITGFWSNLFGDIARIILALLAVISLFIGLYILFRPNDAPTITQAAGMAAKAVAA